MAMGFGSGIMQNIFQSVRLTKRKFDPEMLDINDIKLPVYFSDLDVNRVMRDMKSELQTFKSLGYRFRKLNELEKQEYHSMQIGTLLKGLHLGLDLKVIDNESFFPEYIFTMNHTMVQSKISDIIKKYDSVVSKTSSDAVLRDELIWTPLDACYLLFYLSFYKNVQ